MGRTKSRARCVVCDKPCDSSERNADGTYAHHGCLRATAVWPVDRAASGQHIYGYREEKT